MLGTALRIAGVLVTLILALLAAGAGFLGTVSARSGEAPYRAANTAVCHMLRLAQEKNFIDANKRMKWAKIATPDEYVSGGTRNAKYFMSNCS